MSVKPHELREAIAGNALKMAGEPGQRGSVIRQLAALGYRRTPTVTEGRLDGSTVRIYMWAGTPAGDLILVTGPSFHPRIIGPEDIQTVSKGIYVLSGPDRTKATSHAAKLAETYRVPKVRVEEAPRVRAPAPTVTATAAKKVRTKLARVPEAPPAPSVEAAEKAELAAMLKSILG